MERRITAILAADMVGYSRLMEADEVGTLDRQKRHLIELIDPKIAAHGGRVIKLTGDGLIAEFPSVVEAVQCAVTIQAEMAAREADEPVERRISYRVAINLGDVIFEDGEIYGDGVNIAARLEGLADAGGVIVSGTAYDHLKSNVNVGYEDLGEQQVKNIARPVRAWRVLLDPDEAGRVITKSRSKPHMMAVLTVALAALVIGGFFWLDVASILATDLEELEREQPGVTSIVVLPFSNLSEVEGQDYFADGMTDDLIVRLAKADGLVVIARNTAFTYKGKNVNVQEVGRDLNVRYVLEGSVRREGGKVRVNAQLVDSQTESTVWAEMFHRETDELFELQDDVTTQIAEALKLELGPRDPPGAPRKSDLNLESYDLYLKGMSELRQRRPAAFARARAYLGQALEIEPTYAEVHAAMAFLFWEGRQHGWLQQIGVANSNEAFKLVQHHLDLAKTTPTPMAHLVRSEWLSDMEKDSDGAIAEARRAVALDPSFAEGYVGLAGRLALANQSKEALKMAGMALRLDPVTPPDYHLVVGLAHIVDGNYEAAIGSLEKDVQYGNPKEFPWILLAAAYGHQGKTQDAAEALAVIDLNRKNREHPPFSANQIFMWAIPDLSIRERLFDDLKLAGAPYLDSPISSGKAKRQLSGEEIREKIVPSFAEGIMVGPSGKQSSFTWTVDAGANMDFIVFGQVFKVQYTFYDDKACSQRGCVFYFELTDSEAEKWGHRYVNVEETGLVYYFTVTDVIEAQK